MAEGKQVWCPACGGLIEADDVEQLVQLSKLHTLDAHGYDVPEEHILLMMADGDRRE